MTNEEIKTIIKDSIGYSIDTFEYIKTFSMDDIIKSSDIIMNAFLNGNRLYIIGNGGSAADAQHFEGEMVGRYLIKSRKPLPAQALTTNTSVLTALINDYPSECVFQRQIKAHVREGDVVFCITTSGTSQNILEAFEISKLQKAKIICLTSDNCPKEIIDKYNYVNYIQVTSTITPRIQEAHILIIHILCDIIERVLCEFPQFK